jgi:hypothetical protein
LEGEEVGEGLGKAATSSFPRRELRLSLTHCSERKRREQRSHAREWGVEVRRVV